MAACERICLRCNKPFKSTGAGNRVCKDCYKYQPRAAGKDVTRGSYRHGGGKSDGKSGS